MKTLVLIGDGMADFPLDACGGKTPLAVAKIPAMDDLAASGICGLFMPIPDAFPAGSDIGNLSLFGYDPHTTFSGRAPLEAANQGIELADNELVFRCNLVTLNGDTLEDFTSGHISNDDAHALIELLNASLGSDDLRFHPGVSYRHLMTLKTEASALEEFLKLRCTPPHDIIGQVFAPHLPQGDGNEPIHELMRQSREILESAPTNAARRAAGELPATSVWLWGQGNAPTIETYADRFGIRGAVISAVDLVNGIGRCAGLEVITVPGATGYLDTNYEGKVAAAIDAFDRADFVYLHVEAPDEASHEGSLEKKLQAIQDFDSRVVAPCMEFARQRGDCRVLIAPDHITSIDSRTHAQGAVPFALFGPGVEADARTAYSEEDAKQAGVLYPNGFELVPQMITAERIAAGPSEKVQTS